MNNQRPRRPDPRENRRRTQSPGNSSNPRSSSSARRRPQPEKAQRTSRLTGSNSTKNTRSTSRPQRSGASSSGRSSVIPSQFGGQTALTVLTVIAVILTIAGLGGYLFTQNARHVGSVDHNLFGGSEPNADGATDILLVGVDSRRDAQGNLLSQEEIDMLRAGDEATFNTDTIMVLRVPDDGSSATAISIPRDTYVETKELGGLKINGVSNQTKALKEDELIAQGMTDPDEIDRQGIEAGRKALLETVKDLTGVEIDHYAEVGLLGFVLITDAVGGADVCLLEPVDEPLSGAHFPAGEQTLDGQDALSFVRQRYDLPRGDLDRVARQQAYLASMTKKGMSAATNPGTWSKIRNAVDRSLITDGGWDPLDMAQKFAQLSGKNVKFLTIPLMDVEATTEDGQSIIAVDKDQVHRFFEDLLGDTDSEDSEPEDTEPIPDFTPGDYTVNVFNSSDIDGLASSVGDTIGGASYNIGEVTNHDGDGVTSSQIEVADKSDPAARTLARQLGNLKIVENKDLDEHVINLTLTDSYKGAGLYGPEDLTPAIDTAINEDEVAQSSDDPAIAEAREREIDAGGDGPQCVY